MAIVRVQAPTAVAATDATSIAVTWGSTTTAGNLLIAILHVRQFASISTVPTGMTLLLEQTLSDDDRNWIYYEANCSARSGAQTFTVDVTGDMTLHLVEYSGLRTSSVVDQTATDGSSASSSVKSGTTATTTQASELWIAGICNRNVQTQSAPTNGFTQVNSIHSANTTAGDQIEGALYEKIVSSTGTAEVWATISTSRAYGGVIATLKAATGDQQVTAGDVAATATIPTPTTVGNQDIAVSLTTVVAAATVPGSTATAAATVTSLSVAAAAAVSTPTVTTTATTPGGDPIVSHTSAAGWIRDARQSRFLFHRPPFTKADPGVDA